MMGEALIMIASLARGIRCFSRLVGNDDGELYLRVAITLRAEDRVRFHPSTHYPPDANGDKWKE